MATPRTSPGRRPWRKQDEEDCRRASSALEVIGRRWAPGILLGLARGAERFTEIAAAVPGISPRMLTLRLKDLEHAGFVTRTVTPTTPVSVSYQLSPRGVDLTTTLQPIAGYVQRWSAPEESPIFPGD